MSVFTDWLQKRDESFLPVVLAAQHLKMDGTFPGGQIVFGEETDVTILTEAAGALALDVVGGIGEAIQGLPTGGPAEAMAVETACRHLVAMLMWGLRLAESGQATLKVFPLDMNKGAAPE